MFITHAKTAEEMRAEILSDIERRIEQLNVRESLYEKSARGKAKIAYAVQEFINMKRFWQELKILAKQKSENKLG